MSQIEDKYSLLNDNNEEKYEFKSNNKVAYENITKTKGKSLTIISALTILALFVRVLYINNPSVVVFDEVHFGGFATKYLSRGFFFDVHPPLAKMMIAGIGAIAGLEPAKENNEYFSFDEIGRDYLKDNVPYVPLRLGSAILGVFTVPIAYVTLSCMNISGFGSIVGALFVLFACAAMFYSLYRSVCVLKQPESQVKDFKFWLYLSLTGLSIGAAVSSKWVGLFTIALIGISTILDLWNILINPKNSMNTIFKHFAIRVFTLIIIPIVFYIGTFWLQFAVLNEMGSGGNISSIGFQHSLKGGVMQPTTAEVSFGSKITIRKYANEGSLLHSHDHMYPLGSKQQQVTLYPFIDMNNDWFLLPGLTESGECRAGEFVSATPTEDGNGMTRKSVKIQWLRNGDIIRLEHIRTGRNLHSHPVAPPISDKENHSEVSCYGGLLYNITDTNDNWRVEIVDENGNPIKNTGHNSLDIYDAPGVPVPVTEPRLKQSRIYARRTLFRLVHVNQNCALHATSNNLPAWGFKQGEVTCGRETLKTNSIWIIESNDHEMLTEENSSKVSYEPLGFFHKFMELNRLMWNKNAELIADHPFASRPGSWPLLLRGLGFWNGSQGPKKKSKSQNKNSENDDSEENTAEIEPPNPKFQGSQIYLIGNPFTWWMSSLSIGIFVLYQTVYVLLDKRGFFVNNSSENIRTITIMSWSGFGGFLFFGWILHWIPFFLMKRQLFLHHYLPALYFSILLFSCLMDSISLRISKYQKFLSNAMLLSVCCVAIAVYVKFAPLGYGLPIQTKQECNSLKWLNNWDFDCGNVVEMLSPKPSAT